MTLNDVMAAGKRALGMGAPDRRKECGFNAAKK